MDSKPGILKRLFATLARVFAFVRASILNVAVVVIGILLITALISGGKTVEVKDDTALVLNLNGTVVIEKQGVSPFEKLESEISPMATPVNEILLDDVIMVIDEAVNDPKIQSIVLDLSGFNGAGLDKLRRISDALIAFKASGKVIIAHADGYTQSQYILASTANHLFLNPMGSVIFEGYGRFTMYYKAALEKFKINAHVFRVGTFKSAVEPYLRNDMSDAAKLANSEFTNSLWQQYKNLVAQNRNIDANNFDESYDILIEKLENVDGNFAQYAAQNQWVDELMTRYQFSQFMLEHSAADEKTNGYRKVMWQDYLNNIKIAKGPELPSENDAVGIVVMKGVISDGKRPAGQIGGDSTAKLLRDARLDDKIKAVVLHVDSPGGSAFASEVIRQQVLELKAAGKPVVASMSSVAASGGYWISSAADQIWAHPSTITGSIGVFGLMLSFEDALSEFAGISTDGVATTEFAGMSATRALDPRLGQILQMSVENTYRQFLTIVSDSRGMAIDDVAPIAEGRVWTGEAAKQNGLVDELGGLQDAVAAAAKLAELVDYDQRYIKEKLTPEQILLNELLGNAVHAMVGDNGNGHDNPVDAAVSKLSQQVSALRNLNDPNSTYAICEVCQ